MTTPHDVVATYLHNKAEHDKPAHQRTVVAKRTREIVDELPDGFTKRDVGFCVKVLISSDPVLDDMTDGKRQRAITKALNELVADDVLKLDGDLYYHAGAS